MKRIGDIKKKNNENTLSITWKQKDKETQQKSTYLFF